MAKLFLIYVPAFKHITLKHVETLRVIEIFPLDIKTEVAVQRGACMMHL